jgi:hypothetical protein
MSGNGVAEGNKERTGKEGRKEGDPRRGALSCFLLYYHYNHTALANTLLSLPSLTTLQDSLFERFKRQRKRRASFIQSRRWICELRTLLYELERREEQRAQ